MPGLSPALQKRPQEIFLTFREMCDSLPYDVMSLADRWAMTRWLGRVGKGLGGGPGRGLTTRCCAGEIWARKMRTDHSLPLRRAVYIGGPKAKRSLGISSLQFLGQSEATDILENKGTV